MFFEILCCFLPLNPGTKCFIKQLHDSLYTLEVDHSQTKGWKSDIKSLHRQIHCDKGFVCRSVPSNWRDHKLEFWLVDREAGLCIPACQPCISPALSGAGQRQQSSGLGPPATSAMCRVLYLHSQPKKRKGHVTLCTCCLLQCTIWCSRSPEVFAILAVILLTAWNGGRCIMAMASASSSADTESSCISLAQQFSPFIQVSFAV